MLSGKNKRAGYNKKIRRRNTLRRAVERATQTIRPRRSEKAVQTEEEKTENVLCMPVRPLHFISESALTKCSQKRFNELFDYKLLEDADEPECQLSHAKEIQIDEGSVQSEKRLQSMICVLKRRSIQ